VQKKKHPIGLDALFPSLPKSNPAPSPLPSRLQIFLPSGKKNTIALLGGLDSGSGAGFFSFGPGKIFLREGKKEKFV